MAPNPPVATPTLTRADGQPVASMAEGRRRKQALKEKAERNAKQADVPSKPTSNKAIVEKYLAVVRTRHKDLPATVIESIGKSATKGQAKKVLKAHLQSKPA